MEEGEAVISDIDVYRSAHVLIKQHGEAATIEAIGYRSDGASNPRCGHMLPTPPLAGSF